ncbi:MAG: ChuX/HutX family heme-like substrate-binding protein [Pyrinomonadaceae bacterium]
MQVKAEIGNELRRIWSEFQAANAGVRIRDAARELGVSEGELVACEVGEGVTRLTDDFAGLLQELAPLGRVMALTRNEEVVHERKGVYENVETGLPHGMALFVNPDIDLRIFLGNWKYGFAVEKEGPRGVSRSLQFFGKDGTALHKIFLTESSDIEAYSDLVRKFRAPEQIASIEVSESDPQSPDNPDSEIDVEGLRRDWQDLRDTHDFFPLLRKYKVGRKQALRLAGDELAREVDVASLRFVLQEARDRKVPIMVFVGNRGIIQIHTGTVENVLEARGWYNVMDEDFNLHINESEVDSAYIVRKPTADGVVTSLELFNRNNEEVAMFFGKRKPGIPELEEWRRIIEDLEEASVA